MIFTKLMKSVAVLFMLAWGTNAFGAIVTKPTNLVDGDQYRLVFVTSGTRNALSSNIVDYNSFVTQQANLIPELLALNTTWKVIGSTTTVNALDNTGTNPNVRPGVGIYRLDGLAVAANNAALWSSNLNIPILKTGAGIDYSGPVWTGTLADGTSFPNRSLGGTAFPYAGASEVSQVLWIQWGTFDAFLQVPLYAVSDVITVGSAVPEPNSMMLVGLGMFVWSAKSRRSRKGLT